jgi:membrane protease YdiL (CAAX protease family)
MFLYFKQLFADTWYYTEKLSIESTTGAKNKFVQIPVVTIFIYIALGLSIVKYFGNTDSLLPFVLDGKPGKFGLWFCQFFYGNEIGTFHQKLYWISCIVLIYLIIPSFIVKFGFKKRLRDFGLSIRNIQKDYPLYLLMLAIMFPVVYLASSSLSFQQRYPLFQPVKEPFIPIFIWWQIAYFVQFIAVEFFFRGFILHGLKNRFGFYAIFISMVPYVMVHFGKPFGETLSAIIAGIVLGTLSLKSRSVVLGIIIHYSVAITMDIFALYREGII